MSQWRFRLNFADAKINKMLIFAVLLSFSKSVFPVLQQSLAIFAYIKMKIIIAGLLGSKVEELVALVCC